RGPPSAPRPPRPHPPAAPARAAAGSRWSALRKGIPGRIARADGAGRPPERASRTPGTRLVPAVQPSRSSRRQIEQPLRPERPLVYERLSDPILVKRAKDGDPKALSALCERHAARVERLAAHLLSNPEDARDAAQEALAKLCVRLRQFRSESQFSTWLHRLVVNTCRDVAERRKVRLHEPLAEDLSSGPDHDPVCAAGSSELRRELCQA